MSIKNSFFLVVILFTLNSCSLSDNSIIEGEANDLEARELLLSSIQQVAFNQSSISGRSAGAIMQYFRENDASITYYQRYNFEAFLFDDMWSQGYYAGSLVSLSEMRKLAVQENNEGLTAIASILMAQEYGAMTLMFGDIPFSEALNGESITKPIYDSQADVIAGILALLEDAILLIGDLSIDGDLSEDDLIYQGNLQNWKKMAYGLKARYLFNQRNQNSNRDQEILTLLNNSFMTRSEQADFTFDNGIENPQYTFADFRRSTFSTGDFFLNELETTDDPRKDSFTSRSSHFYEYFILDSFEPKWFSKSASIPMLSYTEILFMKTELSLHLGGSRGETSLLLSDAIRSSMIDNNIDLVDSTLSFITANANLEGLNDEEVVENVVGQAYIAFYGFNFLQSWTNYRRTGYPSITSTASEPSTINPSNIVPRRFLYPQSELEYNLENVEIAIRSQNGALLDSDMWIFN